MAAGSIQWVGTLTSTTNENDIRTSCCWAKVKRANDSSGYMWKCTQCGAYQNSEPR